MKHVTIVGTGMSSDTLTAEGLRALEQADVVLGAPRLLAQFAHLAKPAFAEYAPQAVAAIIHKQPQQRFCVLVSGDSGFYSATEGLCASLKDYKLTVVPGVSSLSYFFARLMRPWQNVRLMSCHGRRANLVEAVRRNPFTFALSGGNLTELAAQLTEAGFGALNAQVGENLGLPQERLITLPINRLVHTEVAKLAVLLIENPAADSRVRFGIADAEFQRGNVPMTKAEVRAVTLSKLALRPTAVCCDIGAGSGSVTVEMALAAYEGEVYALDHNAEAIQLVAANCRAFQVGNVKPLLGSAPQALVGLPMLDAAFIGGSSGKMGEIFAALQSNNPQIRIVVNAVTLETLQAAQAAFASYHIEPDIVQLSVNHAQPVGGMRMLQASSPVFILSGGGHG